MKNQIKKDIAMCDAPNITQENFESLVANVLDGVTREQAVKCAETANRDYLQRIFKQAVKNNEEQAAKHNEEQEEEKEEMISEVRGANSTKKYSFVF